MRASELFSLPKDDIVKWIDKNIDPKKYYGLWESLDNYNLDSPLNEFCQAFDLQGLVGVRIVHIPAKIMKKTVLISLARFSFVLFYRGDSISVFLSYLPDGIEIITDF